MSYAIEHEDQYGNIDRREIMYGSVKDAISFADYLYRNRKDYRRISVVEDITGRLVHEYIR